MHCQQMRWIVVLLAMLGGCSRGHYRLRADRDTYHILDEKSGHQPWAIPPDYQVEPLPASRLSVPGPVDDPALPVAAPQLYQYELPQLPPRDPDRFFRTEYVAPRIDLAAHRNVTRVRVVPRRLPQTRRGRELSPAAYLADLEGGVVHASWQGLEELISSRQAQLPTRQDELMRSSGEIQVTPLPVSAWEEIPATCRRRMFDFESLREQFQLSYERPVGPDEMDQSPRLTLEDVVDLALLNSRDYQTQKESLYRAALRLSVERYDYQLTFTPGGTGTEVDFAHDRSGGTTVNTLAVATTASVGKVLLTGGDLLARFANDVLLTFNGPQGFAADVSSDLLLDVSQTIFQRDIRFEQLTQAERDVVYAARDFARFRKEFFTSLAIEYYNLIRTYRQIEIDAQNYFSLVRAFRQTEAEYRAGLVPRFELDQVEQDVLNGRSRLISTCNNLEQALDNLKLSMGLPTETLLNLDLTELMQLTLRDRLAVTAKLIDRTRQRLATDRQSEFPNRVVLLSTSVVLIDRILEVSSLERELGAREFDTRELQVLQARMQVEIMRLNSEELRSELDEELRGVSPSPPIIFQRTMDLVDTLRGLVERQLELGELQGRDPDQLAIFGMRVEELRTESEAIRLRLQELIAESELLDLPSLVESAQQLLVRVEQLADALDQFIGIRGTAVSEQLALRETTDQVDALLAIADQMLQGLGSGLVAIEIDVDEAMLTALVLRYEVMNERGRLADDWRQIKLAADDLKAILDLTATQTIRTRADVNRPFEFTFDESRTDLRLSFDAPLNRLQERNNFRNELLDYQVAVRQLIDLEDQIKLAVRNDLRGLDLDREQYQIDVASAALAFERVVSTQLEFRLGGGVSARDFLEAQDDYVAALSGVASRHIEYIIDRMQLFLDLELLTVGNDGFWDQLYAEDRQPEPYFQIPPWALPVYGTLPPAWYSKKIRRMLHVPPGNAAIHNETSSALLPPAEPIPLPPEEAMGVQ